MTTAMNKLDVISNNIANVNTTGYKKDKVITQSFSEELMKRLRDPAPSGLPGAPSIGGMSLGVAVDTIFTDFTSGSVNLTGNEFDFAIMGDGFFTVSVTDENGQAVEKYSKDGSFTKYNGTLTTKDGLPVMGKNGIITLPEGELHVSEKGGVYVNGQYIDDLRLTSFSDNQTLRKYKDSLYSATDDSAPEPFNGGVRQGALEAANVNPVREMVDMITVNRLYEANQRVITTIDTALGRSVNDIARKQ